MVEKFRFHLARSGQNQNQYPSTCPGNTSCFLQKKRKYRQERERKYRQERERTERNEAATKRSIRRNIEGSRSTLTPPQSPTSSNTGSSAPRIVAGSWPLLLLLEAEGGGPSDGGTTRKHWEAIRQGDGRRRERHVYFPPPQKKSTAVERVGVVCRHTFISHNSERREHQSGETGSCRVESPRKKLEEGFRGVQGSGGGVRLTRNMHEGHAHSWQPSLECALWGG